MSQASSSQLSSSQMSSSRVSRSSTNSTPNTFGFETPDEDSLAFEPKVIRAKSGERLWIVENTAECIALCKSQLTKEPEGFKFGMEKNRSSPYWEEYTDCIDPKAGLAFVICNHCKTKTAHPGHTTKKNTSGMKSHLDSCAKYKAAARERQRQDGGSEPMFDFFSDVQPTDSPTRGNMTEEKLCEQVLRIITEGNLPFSFAENCEMINLEKHAYPGVRNPNRRSVAARLKSNVVKEKTKLRERLANVDSKISLALDAWTTRNNTAFLAITGHYIDDRFNLHQPLLAFEQLQGSHTGDYLANVVYDVLDDFDICQKLFCITSDNAGNNGTLVRRLEELLWDRSRVVWDHEKHYIRCIAHIINIVVDHFFRDLVDEDGMTFLATLVKIRAIAKALRKSTALWEAFCKCCKDYGVNPMTIPLDCAPRWSSKYLMLEIAVYLRKAIHRLVDDNPKHLEAYRLTHYEWELAEILLVFLMPFKRCTKRFECNKTNPEIGTASASQLITDYVFWAYDGLFNHIEDVKGSLNSQQGLGALPCAGHLLAGLEGMETSLRQYYGATELPTVYGDAMILNPRCKLSIFGTATWDEEQGQVYSDACRGRFMEQYYTAPVELGDTNRSSNKRACTDDAEFNALLEQRSTKRLRNDFDRYIDSPNDVTLKSPLSWYRDHRSSVPDLGRMARDVLAVPASGSAVERVFSVSGRIATWQRNRLSPETISNLMMFKSGMKSNKWEVPDTMAGEPEEFEVPELLGKIPPEWEDDWWKQKLQRPVRQEVLDLFHRSD